MVSGLQFLLLLFMIFDFSLFILYIFLFFIGVFHWKQKDCSPIVWKKHQKTTVRFHCAYVSVLPAFVRRSIRLICLCMFPDSDLIALPLLPKHRRSVDYGQNSVNTVAGPCRIFTCFHLSFPWRKNIKHLLYFLFQKIFYHKQKFFTRPRPLFPA